MVCFARPVERVREMATANIGATPASDDITEYTRDEAYSASPETRLVLTWALNPRNQPANSNIIVDVVEHQKV